MPGARSVVRPGRASDSRRIAGRKRVLQRPVVLLGLAQRLIVQFEVRVFVRVLLLLPGSAHHCRLALIKKTLYAADS